MRRLRRPARGSRENRAVGRHRSCAPAPHFALARSGAAVPLAACGAALPSVAAALASAIGAGSVPQP
jgi:hypothetical protein